MSALARPPVSGDRRADLAAVLAELRMPPAGLHRWLERNRAFCLRHGGRRYYAELLDLYDECLAALDAAER